MTLRVKMIECHWSDIGEPTKMFHRHAGYSEAHLSIRRARYWRAYENVPYISRTNTSIRRAWAGFRDPRLKHKPPYLGNKMCGYTYKPP